MRRSTSGGLGLLSLSHVSLSTKNLSEAEHFYTEILGGKKVFDLTNATTGLRYGTFISMGNGTFVEIFDQADLPKPGSVKLGSPYRHLCLQVRSIKQAADWLENFGYQPQIKIGKVDGVPQFFITGPDGVEIEFHEYCKGCPQRNYVMHEG